MVTADAIDVRPAKKTDVASVLQLDHQPERADDVRHAVEGAHCLVAEITGELVGFCVGGRFFGFDFLELLVVATAYRRQGVGTKLIEAWEKTAGTEKLFTSTNESRTCPCSACANALGTSAAGSSRTWTKGTPRSSTSRSTCVGAAKTSTRRR
jgi:GNAT superfamily N-acetyltransferase